MTNYTRTYWFTNGRQRIVREITMEARSVHELEARLKPILRQASPSGDYVCVNADTIEKVRGSYEFIQVGGTRTLVLVCKVRGNYQTIEVESWTQLMITVGRYATTDGFTSIFLDTLRK